MSQSHTNWLKLLMLGSALVAVWFAQEYRTKRIINDVLGIQSMKRLTETMEYNQKRLDESTRLAKATTAKLKVEKELFQEVAEELKQLIFEKSILKRDGAPILPPIFPEETNLKECQ